MCVCWCEGKGVCRPRTPYKSQGSQTGGRTCLETFRATDKLQSWRKDAFLSASCNLHPGTLSGTGTRAAGSLIRPSECRTSLRSCPPFPAHTGRDTVGPSDIRIWPPWCTWVRCPCPPQRPWCSPRWCPPLTAGPFPDSWALECRR